MGKTAVISATDEQEIAETRGSPIADLLYDVGARAATTTIGQFVYRRIDNLLWTVEKTARWSLPQPGPVALATKPSPAGDESEDVAAGNISGPPLIRPLPWLLFLPALILLRVVRSTLSVGSRLIGQGPVLPAGVVSFLQNKRRKLRALKYRGQRLQRIAKAEREASEDRVTWLERIILPLRTVICTRGYRGSHEDGSDVAHAVVFRKERIPEASEKRVGGSKKRNLNQREAESVEEEASNEESFEDASCKALLDKYEDDEDSSFHVEDVSSGSSDSNDSSLSDSDPSSKKPALEGDRVPPAQQAQQQKQNGSQQPPAKATEAPHKRSADVEKNGVETQQPATKPAASKTINASSRSKSAADLENGNAQSATGGSEAKGANGTNPPSTTPSKSIPNLSSSPENNENKPINQNGPIAPGALKSPPNTILKSSTTTTAGTKQSPNASMSDVRSNFQQQKQPNQKHQPASQQVVGSVQHQQQHQQQQQYVSNGGKNRNKKLPAQANP
ncbi:uncharacterized protein LOC128725561 [Anopheles nili]|uniref:uncharacterized protein LOC128725561 n=1 Tax=Anopheles nili TaxID=185578 RepID=UPI00237A86F8|nr:uncharacterized protein LOC128725561 [Anopheles nili]